jgi:hypothetical protein
MKFPLICFSFLQTLILWSAFASSAYGQVSDAPGVCKYCDAPMGSPHRPSCPYYRGSHSLPDPNQEQVLNRLRLRTAAEKAALLRDHKIVECNELVQAIAGGYGYHNFEKRDVDDIVRFLMSKMAKGEDWVFVSKNAPKNLPEAIGLREASEYANAGYLVIGVIHSALRNLAKPEKDGNGDPINDGKPFTHGHIFVVLGGHPSNDDDWIELNVLNAGGSKTKKHDHRPAQELKANDALLGFEKPLVTFYVLFKP